MRSSENDAEKIYSSLFNKSIPVAIRDHFNNISKEIDNYYPQSEVRNYYELVQKINDLEAFELAARHLKKYPILTTKFKTMLYLAETVPDNYTDFINESDRCLSGYLLLSASVFRSLYKFIKGLFILSFTKT